MHRVEILLSDRLTVEQKRSIELQIREHAATLIERALGLPEPYPTEFSPNGPSIIRRHAHGNFYINMGYPGFNSRTNNSTGYPTREMAQDVIDGTRSRFY